MEYVTSRLIEYKTRLRNLSQLLNQIQIVLEEMRTELQIEFVSGKGTRKSEFQRLYEEFTDYFERMQKYETQLAICGNRNSYSKTDHDATFMHGKEDYYMKTGIFKPYYNLQIGLSSEYIWVLDVNQRSADMKTFIPLMDIYHDFYQCYPQKPVADAGYGSYENYMHCLSNGMKLFMKYPMYANEQEKASRQDPFRKENYRKDQNGNWLCPVGHIFEYERDKISKHGSYIKIDQFYKVKQCKDCPLREKCHSKTKKNEEEKTMQMNPIMNEMHETVRFNLNSEEGIQLRMNRSIQAEGAFGVIKEDWQYRRVHRRGLKKVKMELFLIAIGFNLMKYHNRKYRKDSVIPSYH